MDQKSYTVFKLSIFFLSLVPAVHYIYGVYFDLLGVDPIETILHGTGEWALRFLLLTLAITPLSKISYFRQWMKLRRMLGLYAFFYALLHFLIWLILDQTLIVELIIEDIIKRPYITIGFVAFLLLIPLALTSNHWAMKKLGRRWKRLHRLIYLIVLLALLHFLWGVKADLLEPAVYFLIYLALMSYRVLKVKASSFGSTH